MDAQAKGFSLLHNYWCNLFNERALNGAFNKGRPYAIASLITICLTLAYFWFFIASEFINSLFVKKLMQGLALFSLALTCFLFTPLHDEIINIAGFPAMVALALAIWGLYGSKEQKLGTLGLFCLVLFFVNGSIYYTTHFIEYLPIIQKFTILCFIFWICLVSWNRYKTRLLS